VPLCKGIAGPKVFQKILSSTGKHSIRDNILDIFEMKSHDVIEYFV